MKTSFYYAMLSALALAPAACGGSDGVDDPMMPGADAGEDDDAHAGDDDDAPGGDDDDDDDDDDDRPDSDGDGIPDDEDICPDTPDGDDTNTDGCGDSQVDDDGNPLDPDAADFQTFMFPGGDGQPMAIKTLESNVEPVDGGYALGGTVLFETPLGHIPMLGCSLGLIEDTDTPGSITAMAGSCEMQLPDFGVLSGLEMDSPVTATINYDQGANIDIDAPLAADRTYFAFQLQAGLGASLGPVSMDFGGESLTLVLDPRDPAFFVSGSLAGLSALGPLEDVALGLSAQGTFPFAPTNVWGIGKDLGNFSGNLYTQATVGIGQLPLSVTGEIMVDLDPDGDGPVFADATPDLQIGGNGSLALSVEFLPFTTFDLDLGQASAGGYVGGGTDHAFVSGTLEPDTSFLPAEIPVQHTSVAHVAAMVSENLETSWMSAEAELSLDASELGDAIGLSLNPITLADGSISADSSGVTINASTPGSFHPLIAFTGAGADVAAHFNSPTDWSVELSGDMSVSGVDLGADATATLTPAGIEVHGMFAAPMGAVEMSGIIDSTGFHIGGSADVEIDVVAGNEVTQWVTNGAVCGYSWVTDAAVCGTETVVSGAICGYDVVTDAAVCGWDTVTSAAQCGTSWITCSSGDWWNPTTWSCEVANTCDVAATCSVEASCPVAQSCYDFSQPLSCWGTVTVPDYDFGDFVGAIDLGIGTGGLYGDVSGQYCPTGGTCVTLAGGSLQVGDPMQACIDIPAVGPACAPF